jgi:hypothetical protein
MNIEGIPEGYELVRVGKAKDDDLVIDANGKVVRAGKAVRAFAFNSVYPIIRKIHNETELCYEMSHESGQWLSVKTDEYIEITPLKKLGQVLAKVSFQGKKYDLILCRVAVIDHWSQWVYLGHWNDGPIKEGE